MNTPMTPQLRSVTNLGNEFDDVSSVNGAPRYPSPWNKWFPYEPIPCSPKLGPYKENCTGGQVYHFCTCGESRNQPWCESDASGACAVNPKFTPIQDALHRGTGVPFLHL